MRIRIQGDASTELDQERLRRVVRLCIGAYSGSLRDVRLRLRRSGRGLVECRVFLRSEDFEQPVHANGVATEPEKAAEHALDRAVRTMGLRMESLRRWA